MAQNTALQEKSDIKLKKPKLYKVILHNDDYTTMDFVVEILVIVFNKTILEANSIMMNVHKQGKGIAGVYSYDIAITKINQVDAMAKSKQFPLKTSLEEV
jgi:ATP-dependent Clp protease adaptor protein ClpS